MKKQYQLKYKNFQYTNVIKNKLKYKLKGSEEEKFKSVYNQLLLSKGKYNISLNIAEDVFKLIYIYKFPSILLAEIYEVSKRSVELWAKDLMLTKKQLKNDINYINRKDEFKEFKDKEYDRLADFLREHLDIDKIYQIMQEHEENNGQ